MEEIRTLSTRRGFLRTTLLGGALSWTVPAFIDRTLGELEIQAAQTSYPSTGRDAPILVVLQLAGGNDGLNTVVPFADDHYHRARPRLALSPDAVLKFNDHLGLHPSLKALRTVQEAGHLCIVQGVGYPNPNRSHFRSTEIWQTASDAERVERQGWVGRYFDHCCAGAEPTVGLSLGRERPQAFTNQSGKGVSVGNPEAFRIAGLDPRDGMSVEEESFVELNRPMVEAGPEADSGATIGSVGAARRVAGSALDYVERTALDAQVSVDEVRRVAAKGPTQTGYPASELGNGMKWVARLIGGGLPARVYYVSQGGYDTHTNQTGTQARLLQDLGNALAAFVADLKAQGNFDRVLVMTFSEFGRRLAENANQGTDHGAAAPLFIVASKPAAALLGRSPGLAPSDLLNGDPRFQVDFRSVYAAVLEQWLRVRSESILGRKFEAVKLV